MDKYIALAVLASGLLWLRKKQQKRVLHIKGFASFYDRKRTSVAVACALEFIKKYRPSKVVWDGDDYNPESFTAVISALSLLREEDALRRFHFFACRGDVPQARNSWENRLRGRLDSTETSIVPTQRVSDAKGEETFVFCQTDYKNLGLSALRATQATDVLVLGVGPCVAQEIQEAASELPSVMFHVVDIPRYTNSLVKQSLGVFFACIPENVKVIPTHCSKIKLIDHRNII